MPFLNASYLPDILFLDIKMPEMNGLETAKELRKLNQQMIIIFVTVTTDSIFKNFSINGINVGEFNVNSVPIYPGLILFTRTPRFAHSIANDFVSCITAAFASGKRTWRT